MTHSFQSWPLIFPFLFNLSGFVLNFLGWGCVIFTENILLCYCLQAVLPKTWFFSVTKDNNDVQIFSIYPNNDLMCAISRDNVKIILISDIRVYIKVQLVLSVWKKMSLSKSVRLLFFKYNHNAISAYFTYLLMKQLF
jgi:hypothetical protein